MGHPNTGKPLAVRFNEKFRVSLHTGCWLWTASLDTHGYGHIRANGKVVSAPRVSWLLHNGPIQDGAFVLHTCHNRSCVKPGHLMLGDHNENMRHTIGRRWNTGNRFHTSKNWRD